MEFFFFFFSLHVLLGNIRRNDGNEGSEILYLNIQNCPPLVLSALGHGTDLVRMAPANRKERKKLSTALVKIEKSELVFHL